MSVMAQLNTLPYPDRRVVPVSAPERPENSIPLRKAEKQYFSLLGLGSWLFVRLIGYLTFAEVFLLATFPFRLRRFMAACTQPGILPLTTLWLLWCVWVVVTDYLNSTPFENFARGIAKAGCCGIIIITFYDLIRKNLRALDWYLPAYALSHLVGQFVFRDGGAIEMERRGQGLDWGWEGQTNYVVMSFAYAIVALTYRRAPRLTAMGVFALGLINTANGSRSSGALGCLVGFMLLTVVPAIQSRKAAKKKRVYWSSRMKLVTVALAFVIAIAGTYGIYKSYAYFARSGTFGVRAMKKFEAQDAVKGGALVGGRFGFFVAIYAVAHRPFLGHGSWAMDDFNYVERTAQWLDLQIEAPKERHFIPSHSMIMTSWVDHGLAGGLFWIYVFAIIVVGVWRVPAVCPEYTAFIWLTSGLFLWALLFSPIQQRMYLAVHVAPILVVNERYRQGVLAVRGMA